MYPIHKIQDIRTLHGSHNVSAIQCGWKGGRKTTTKEAQATSKAGRKTKTKEGATIGSTEAQTAQCKCQQQNKEQGKPKAESQKTPQR